MEFLIKHWNVAGMKGLAPDGQKAQEDLMNLLGRFKKLTDRQMGIAKRKKQIEQPFSWIFNKKVNVYS